MIRNIDKNEEQKYTKTEKWERKESDKNKLYFAPPPIRFFKTINLLYYLQHNLE